MSKNREFLAVFQQDGSFELSEFDTSKHPIELSSASNSLDIHLHDENVGFTILFPDEMSHEFLMSERVRQVWDAIDAKLNNDDI